MVRTSRIRATALVLGLGAVALVGDRAGAAPLVNLGTAASFGVLAGTTVTNTGPSVITGDLGVSPGTAVTGFPPGIVTGGTIHSADALALQAKTDLTSAYNVAAGLPCGVDLSGQDLGGLTLTPGVYCFSSSASLTGDLTLSAPGNPNGEFIFKTVSTLITASSSRVLVTNGAQACKVFAQVGSSATLGTNTQFVGTILALTSITATTGASVQGGLLARNGAVTLDTNSITSPTCAPGVLSITNPLTADFAGKSITGAAQTTTAALNAFSVSDLTGSGSGWHVTAQASRFTGVDRQLAAGSLSMSAPTIAPAGPTVVPGPTVIDNGAAAQIASAAPGAGMGVYDFSATTLTLALPAGIYADVYASTVTISVVSGP
jgi:hypothetical protein